MGRANWLGFSFNGHSQQTRHSYVGLKRLYICQIKIFNVTYIKRGSHRDGDYLATLANAKFVKFPKSYGNIP